MTQRQDSRESRCNQAKTWNRVEKRERFEEKDWIFAKFYGDKKVAERAEAKTEDGEQTHDE